jgi:hypothetical protein
MRLLSAHRAWLWWQQHADRALCVVPGSHLSCFVRTSPPHQKADVHPFMLGASPAAFAGFARSQHTSLPPADK